MRLWRFKARPPSKIKYIRQVIYSSVTLEHLETCIDWVEDLENKKVLTSKEALGFYMKITKKLISIVE